MKTAETTKNLTRFQIYASASAWITSYSECLQSNPEAFELQSDRYTVPTLRLSKSENVILIGQE